jgi:hypothetical protein
MDSIALIASLSRKRLALIAEDPEVVFDLIDAADEEMPGVLNLGSGWKALGRICGPKAAAAVTGEGGQPVPLDLGEGSSARILSGDQVRELSDALPRHGDEDPELVEKLEQLRDLYAKAAKAGDAMLVAIVAE